MKPLTYLNNLQLDEAGWQSFQQHWTELRQNYLLEGDMESVQRMDRYLNSSLVDFFCPYDQFSFSESIQPIPDETSISTAGCFVTDSLNYEDLFNSLTMTTIVENNAWTFGVADNATQIKEYAKTWLNEGDLSLDKTYAILMTPILKSEQGNWRWKKWGEYIGVQQPTTEYLGSEPEIEYVFVFTIEEVVAK